MVATRNNRTVSDEQIAEETKPAEAATEQPKDVELTEEQKAVKLLTELTQKRKQLCIDEIRATIKKHGFNELFVHTQFDLR